MAGPGLEDTVFFPISPDTGCAHAKLIVVGRVEIPLPIEGQGVGKQYILGACEVFLLPIGVDLPDSMVRLIARDEGDIDIALGIRGQTDAPLAAGCSRTQVCEHGHLSPGSDLDDPVADESDAIPRPEADKQVAVVIERNALGTRMSTRSGILEVIEHLSFARSELEVRVRQQWARED